MKVLEQSITYRDTFLAVVECEYCGGVERDVFGKDKYGYLLEKESAKEGYNAAIAMNNI